MSRFQRGFSLLEAVVVIVITGIMLAAVALFLRWPFQSYMDTSRRAQMTDVVDTALRRIGRDLHVALPNSVRVSGATPLQTCVEMLPTITGGRYRAVTDNNNHGDILDFTNPLGDISFEMFGQFPAAQTPVLGNQVVVYNLGPSSPGADAYAGNTTAAIQSVIFPDVVTPNAPAGETLITLQAAKLFPLASPGNRFQVIGPNNNAAVSYVCTPTGVNAQGSGIGMLSRVTGYPTVAVQVCPPVGGVSTPLANNVSLCSFQYTIPQSLSNAPAREGMLQMRLGVTKGNEAVSLYHEVHINNAP
jgi:MSHA biogenesis protein MshO